MKQLSGRTRDLSDIERLREDSNELMINVLRDLLTRRAPRSIRGRFDSDVVDRYVLGGDLAAAAPSR